MKHNFAHPSPSFPLLVLFLVCTVTLRRLDTQGRLNGGKRGNAEENDGNEHEKDEKKTGDECGREQLIACKDAALWWRWGGNRRRAVLTPRTRQNNQVARIGASNPFELTRKADFWAKSKDRGDVPVSFYHYYRVCYKDGYARTVLCD